MPAASDTTTQGALLKELYSLPPVRVLNDKSFLHDTLQKVPADLDFSGKYVRWPVTVQRSLGGGSRSDGAELPTAVAEVDLEAKAFAKYHYHALEWTEVVQEVSKNKVGAFESIVARKMRNVATDMAKSLNRQWYNPLNGTVEPGLASTSGAPTVTTASGKFPQFVHVGDLLDIVTISTGVAVTNGTRRTVTAITSAGVITFGDGGGNLAVTAGTHGLVVTGNWGNEIDGLRAVAEKDRILHGIDGNTYDVWDGNRLNVSGAVAGESTLEQLYDRVGERGRGDIDTMLSTRGVRRRLADEFASQRRLLNEKSLDIKAGYRSIELNVGGGGVEMVIDDDCPKGYVFAFAREVLKVLQVTQPGFLEDEHGAARIELKDSTNSGRKMAAFQSWYRYHCTLACNDPARTGMIPDAEDDSPNLAAT
jgi:hypothetical protein